MARRGHRTIQGSRAGGGDDLTIFLIDDADDLALLTSPRIGDSAHCIAAGADDGKVFVAVKSSAGTAWTEMPTDANSVTGDFEASGDITAGDRLIAVGDVESGAKVKAVGVFVLADGANSTTVQAVENTAPRTVNMPDRSGTVVVGPETAHSDVSAIGAGSMPGPTGAEIADAIAPLVTSYNGLLAKLRTAKIIDA